MQRTCDPGPSRFDPGSSRPAPRPMRLLFYSYSFLPTAGGAEIMLHNLATGLSARGHSVTVLCPRVRGHHPIDAPYRVVRYQRPSSKRFGVRQVLLYLIREKLLHGFDLLHCHDTYPPGFVGASFKRMFGVPLVIRPHGSDILPEETTLSNLRLRHRVGIALQRADRIIAQGNELKELILQFSIPEDRVALIPNGVDLALFRGPCRNRLLPEPYLLTLASAEPKKGLDTLIEAMALLKDQGETVKLVIAGQGRYDAYAALARTRGLEARILFPGVLRGEGKIDAIRGCLFGVCASRREPFSNSNLEFMAAGKFLVATRVGGNPEMIQNGVNGILVEKEDPRALASAMRSALRDPELSGRLAANAGRMVARFALERAVDAYETLYRSLL